MTDIAHVKQCVPERTNIRYLECCVLVLKTCHLLVIAIVYKLPKCASYANVYPIRPSALAMTKAFSIVTFHTLPNQGCSDKIEHLIRRNMTAFHRYSRIIESMPHFMNVATVSKNK